MSYNRPLERRREIGTELGLDWFAGGAWGQGGAPANGGAGKERGERGGAEPRGQERRRWSCLPSPPPWARTLAGYTCAEGERTQTL